jgi:hypothetical protein
MAGQQKRMNTRGMESRTRKGCKGRVRLDEISSLPKDMFLYVEGYLGRLETPSADARSSILKNPPFH